MWGGEGQGRGPAGEKFKATQGGDKRIKALQPMRTGRESVHGATGGQPQVAWPMKKQQVLCALGIEVQLDSTSAKPFTTED